MRSLPPDLEQAERTRDTLRLSGNDLRTRLPSLQSRLQDAGLVVQDLTVRKPTLEEKMDQLLVDDEIEQQLQGLKDSFAGKKDENPPGV